MSTAQLLPNVLQTWFTSNGLPLSGGQIFSYIAGTTTPQATYTDETAATPNTNPVVLNSAGQATIWLRTDLSYKIIIEDASNNVIATIDNINIVNPGTIDKTKVAANIAGAALLKNGGGSFDVQVDNVYIQINGSNQLTLLPGAITPDFLPASSKLEVIFKNTRDYSDPGSIKQIPQYFWTSPILLAGPTGPGTGNGIKWSPNGEFLALGSSSTPYIDIYQYSPLTGFTKLSDPGTIPTGAVLDVEWSPCGDFLAITTTATPYIIIYQRIGNTFTKLSDPASIPSGYSAVVGLKVAFSPNSDFLALTYSSKNIGGIFGFFIILYERSGTTFNDITDSGSGVSTIIGDDEGHYVTWSPDSSMLATLDISTGLVDVFERADNVFTGITAPVLTPYANDILGIKFSPDGNLFSVLLSVSPYILIFNVSSGVFTQCTNQISLGGAGAVAFSPNSQYISVGYGVSPYIYTYAIANPTSPTTTTFTLQTAVASPPAAVPTSLNWSHTGQFLALSTTTTPYIQIYKTASSFQSDALLWVREVQNV